MSVEIEPMYGIIRAAPTAPAIAGTHRYTVDAIFPGGSRMAGITLPPPAVNIWEPPLFVRPMPVGRIVHGFMVNGQQQQWHYQETADFGICGSGLANASRGSGSGLRAMLADASTDDLRLLKKLLAEVDV